MTYSNVLLRCTSCANVLCDLKACKCGCHKLEMTRDARYSQHGNGAVRIE